MQELKKLFLTSLVLFFFSGCGKSESKGTGSSPDPFVSTTAAGTFNSKTWTFKAGVAKKVTITDEERLQVRLYAEELSQECATFPDLTDDRTIALIAEPKVGSWNSSVTKNLVTFIFKQDGIFQNNATDQALYAVDEITETRVKGRVSAKEVFDGVEFNVNGVFDVPLCQ